MITKFSQIRSTPRNILPLLNRLSPMLTAMTFSRVFTVECFFNVFIYARSVASAVSVCPVRSAHFLLSNTFLSKYITITIMTTYTTGRPVGAVYMSFCRHLAIHFYSFNLENHVLSRPAHKISKTMSFFRSYGN